MASEIDEIRARFEAEGWLDVNDDDLEVVFAALDAKDAELRAVEWERDEAREGLTSAKAALDAAQSWAADLESQLARAKAEGAREVRRQGHELSEARRELSERRSIGARLSNIAFNLAQIERLTADERRSCDETRREWDAIVAARLAGEEPSAMEIQQQMTEPGPNDDPCTCSWASRAEHGSCGNCPHDVDEEEPSHG